MTCCVYDLAIAPVEFAERDGRAVRRARVRQGSNNWAIAGRRTASGRPILANDPHRAQGVPSLRYLAHLVAPGLNVIGAGEPALPGISIGHNERIAFGLTIFAIDQEDLYVYETRPGSPDEYRYRDGWERDDRHRGGRSRCKDSAPERVTLRFTRHGPVIAEDERRRTAFAVRSVWFEPGTSAYFASIAYMRAGNWREFVSGLRRWGAPGENQVYADRAGHIGWKPCGFTPIRHNWDGLLPVPGDGRYEWDGFLDPDRLPVERDPARGWFGDGERGEPAARVPVPARARSASSGRRPSGCSASRRCCAASAMRPWPTRGASRSTTVRFRLRGSSRCSPASSRATAAPRARSGCCAAGTATSRRTPAPPRCSRSGTRSSSRPRCCRAALGSQKAVDAIWPGDPTVILDLLERPDQRLGRHPRRARDRALLTSLERAIDRTEALLGKRWSRWAWGGLHVAQLRAPDRAPRSTTALARRLAVGPVPVGGGGETVGDTGYEHRPGRPRASRRRGRSSRSPRAPRSAR